MESTDEVADAIVSLYLLLQMEIFNEIDKAEDEASEALTYLYGFMFDTHSIFVQEYLSSPAHIINHLIREVVLDNNS